MHARYAQKKHPPAAGFDRAAQGIVANNLIVALNRDGQALDGGESLSLASRWFLAVQPSLVLQPDFLLGEGWKIGEEIPALERYVGFRRSRAAVPSNRSQQSDRPRRSYSAPCRRIGYAAARRGATESMPGVPAPGAGKRICFWQATRPAESRKRSMIESWRGGSSATAAKLPACCGSMGSRKSW